MKKAILILCAVLVLSVLGACTASSPAPQSETQAPASSSAEASSSAPSESASVPESSSAASSGSESAPATSQSSDAAETVDYVNTDYSEWLYTQKAVGEIPEIFFRIDTLEHAKAGASLAAAQAADGMLRLTKKDDVPKELEHYLSRMSAIQRDYFSFQWQYTASFVSDALAEPDFYTGIFSDAGCETALSEYSAEEFEALCSEAEKLFEATGIGDVWKEHTDLEPFYGFLE